MSRRHRRHTRPTCYACHRKATSRDHVPPRAFFLSARDTAPSASQRQNLITVPSCEHHNIGKSGDDLYLLAVTTTYIENNALGEKVFDAVVLPSLRRRPWLARTFFPDLAPARVGPIDTGAYIVDRKRFDTAAALIAAGVHFHHFGKKATGRARVLTYSMIDVSSANRDRVNQALMEWRAYSEQALSSAPRFGDNPRTFYYQVVADSDGGRVVVRLVFYEGVVVDIMFQEGPDGDG